MNLGRIPGKAGACSIGHGESHEHLPAGPSFQNTKCLDLRPPESRQSESWASPNDLWLYGLGRSATERRNLLWTWPKGTKKLASQGKEGTPVFRPGSRA